MTPAAAVRLAVDVAGPELPATDVLEAVRSLTAARPGLSVVLVGDPAVLATPLPPGVEVVPAFDRIGPEDDAARAVRARRGASVRVATRLVQDGRADAVVSFGPAAATLAAAQFSLGRLPGMTQVCLAAELPFVSRPAVLVDGGAGPAGAPETLVQYAYAGAVYARTQLGAAAPVVGLLSAGFRPGSGDPAYDETDRRLREVAAAGAVPFTYGGEVPVDAVWAGDCPVDVVVTSGFTGAVLVGALTRLTGASHADGRPGPKQSGDMSAIATPPVAGSPARSMVALGVNGVVVASAGSPAPGSVTAHVLAGLTRAADTVAHGVVPALTDEMARLLARRRESATSASFLGWEAGR